MYFLLTRPQEDSDRIAQALQSHGAKTEYSPLLRIDYFPPQDINLDQFQALLFTSANGVRACIKNSDYRDVACYVVGDATAAEAKNSGFPQVFTAGGDVKDLANLIIKDLDPKAGPLLHISGKNVAGNLTDILENSNFYITSKQLYEAVKVTSLSQNAQNLLASGAITHIPFYSPRTARAFVACIKAANLQTSLINITAICLSSAISNVINSLTWKDILTASLPDQLSLFKMIDINLEEIRQ